MIRNIQRKVLAAAALAGIFLIPSQSFAEPRYEIDTPNGRMSCIWKDGAYADCVDPASLRHEIDTPAGRQSCLWQDGAYKDCRPVAAAAAPAADAPAAAAPATINLANDVAVADAPASQADTDALSALDGALTALDDAALAAEEARAASAKARADEEARIAATRQAQAEEAARIAADRAAAERAAQDARIAAENARLAEERAKAEQARLAAASRSFAAPAAPLAAAPAADANAADANAALYTDPAYAGLYADVASNAVPEDAFVIDNGLMLGFSIGWGGRFDGTDRSAGSGCAFDFEIGYKWKYIFVNLTLGGVFTGAEYEYIPDADGTDGFTLFASAGANYQIGNSHWLASASLGLGVVTTKLVDSQDDQIGDYSTADFALKFGLGIDYVFTKLTLGARFQWMPMMSNGSNVDNVVGLAFRIGGIL